MNNYKHKLFTRHKPYRFPNPLVLLSGSCARQSRLSRILDTIVYAFPKNALHFDEGSWNNSHLISSSSQHIEIIKKKWSRAETLLSHWKGPSGCSWSTYLALVCDTLVFSDSRVFGKPTHTQELSAFYRTYFDEGVRIVTRCKGAWVKNYMPQTPVEITTECRFSFDDSAQQHIRRLLKEPETAFLCRAAGGIDIEWFTAMGWVSLSTDEYDTAIGIPWKNIQDAMT